MKRNQQLWRMTAQTEYSVLGSIISFGSFSGTSDSLAPQLESSYSALCSVLSDILLDPSYLMAVGTGVTLT